MWYPEARLHQVPWNWNYKAAIWMLRPNPGPLQQEQVRFPHPPPERTMLSMAFLEQILMHTRLASNSQVHLAVPPEHWD